MWDRAREEKKGMGKGSKKGTWAKVIRGSDN
jgi:hypothetical protein